MQYLKRFLLIGLGALFFTGWHWLLPSRVHPLTPSAVPSAELVHSAEPPNRSLQASAPPPNSQLSTFLEADRLYRQGNIARAEALYRRVKPEFARASVTEIPEPIYEAEALDPETLVNWNNAQTALEGKNLEVAIQALQLVVAAQPEFIPASLQLAETLEKNDQEEEAIAVLEQAATLYPNSAEIVMAQVKALAEADNHLEASIAAREFSVLNLDHPQAEEFVELADDELRRFSRSRREQGILGGIGNILGRIFISGETPWESWDSAVETYQLVRLMLGDESEFGSAIAREYKQQLTLVEDPEVVDYVTQLGLEVARLMGRDLDYEFYVVRDNAVNAFALPGGKLFVNTGLMLATRSQAELAGVLAHEAAHATFSHGVQSFFRDNLLAQLSEEIPLGEFVTKLVSLHYSRRQEQQSDILGNRVLATAGYAADGLRNFMATLSRNTPANPIEYLSSHPAPASRVTYLEELIQRNGYNRYALEGVDRHLEIQARLRSL